MNTVQSYSHQLLDKTAFTQIEKNDTYLTCCWKVPVGRITSACLTLAALVEATFFTVLTLVTSPLYLIDNDRFSVISGNALDAAKTVGLSAGRFFGIGTIEKEEPPITSQPQSQQPPPPPSATTTPKPPTSKRKKVSQSLKGRISQIPHLALKHPNASFVSVLGAVIGAVSWIIFKR